MGINIEETSNTFVINTKEDGTFENEDDIVCAVMESMTPFLKRYIHNLLCDFDIFCDFTDNPESERKVDIITEYTTYNK